MAWFGKWNLNPDFLSSLFTGAALQLSDSGQWHLRMHEWVSFIQSGEDGKKYRYFRNTGAAAPAARGTCPGHQRDERSSTRTHHAAGRAQSADLMLEHFRDLSAPSTSPPLWAITIAI